MLQVLQLGTLGSETLLPSESRTFDSTAIEEFVRQGRSIDGTLHVDFINTKRQWVVSWGTLKQADLDSIIAIYNEQFTNGGFLNFIVSNSLGGTAAYTVKMNPFQWSNQTFKDDWYYSGVSINLLEV